MNFEKIDEFHIAKRGETRGSVAGNGWDVRVTIGSMTHHLHDKAAFEAFKVFDELTRDPQSPPNW